MGAATILRTKSVRIMGSGLLVRTWLSEIEIHWTDMTSMRRPFPFSRTILVTSRRGWFLLGEELSRFDDLVQYITVNKLTADTTP
jgi:hypothetical protein